MREIKFRGKAIDTDEWVYGVPIPNGFGTRVFMITLILGDDVAYPMERLYEFCREVIPETVSQYTGTNDNHGEDIYEVDILKNEKGNVGHVAFLIQESGYAVVLKNSDYRLGHRNTGEHYTVAQGHEVIGNKLDNPELLEG